jgi:hypothetical protein
MDAIDELDVAPHGPLRLQDISETSTEPGTLWISATVTEGIVLFSRSDFHP